MKEVREVNSICIRFAGDSGDGMQLVGERFANISAWLGNEVNSFPDFPAEIRPPAGTVGGVSGYQLNIGRDIYTHGDLIDVLVAMNPAAIKAATPYLRNSCSIIVDSDSITDKNLEKAQYSSNPLSDGSLSSYNVFSLPMTTEVKKVLSDSTLGNKDIIRCKNFFALGLSCWYLDHPIESTLKWLSNVKFKSKPEVASANQKALKAGYDFGENSTLFHSKFKVRKSSFKPGYYKFVTGNSATALGLLAAADRADRMLFLGSYPITPASEILHELSGYKNFNVKVLQGEDEIASTGAAIGASLTGAIGAVSTSGPGLALKQEFINLAVITEIPLVIIDVQRGGPSTGLPTKMEQADVFQAIWGRNGESPLPVLAARSPSDCFFTVIEATRLAIKYMTPVIVLTDGYMSLGADILKVPNKEELPEFEFPPLIDERRNGRFMPYVRDSKTLARPWISFGTPNFMHRTGGLEKEDITGKYTTDPENHHKMCLIRAAKVGKIADEYPPTEVFGDNKGELLIISWGSSFGGTREAVIRLRKEGFSVSHAHLRYLFPIAKDLGTLMTKFKKVLIPENNLGQYSTLLKAEFLIKIETLSKVKGQPFTALEIENKVKSLLGEKHGRNNL